MSVKTTVIDAGGRYGIHPTWKGFSGELAYYLFEPDSSECERLVSKYANRADEVNILNLALDECDGLLEIDLFRNRAMSSSAVRNPISSLFKNERLREVQIINRIQVQSRSIDSFSVENNLKVDFLKLDTEGSEYEIILGARKQISSNVIGIRVEVSFDHIFVGKPLFGTISEFLLNAGFFLLNLDYNGRGDYQNEFVNLDNRYGVLTATDAVFLRRKELFFEMEYDGGKSQAIRTLKYAAFCFENGAPDVGLDILLHGRKDHGVDFESVMKTSLFGFVDRSVHRLFYSLKWQPGQSLQRHADCYKQIFGKQMKTVNDYMESLELNPD